MKLTGDFHTHTQFSHGKGSIELNARAAMECGLQSLAFTDHGLDNILGGLRNVEIVLAKAKIDAVRKKYPQLKMYFGIESNIIAPDGTIDIPKEHRNTFEVLLMGFHAVAWNPKWRITRTFIWRNYRHKHDVNLAELIEINTNALIRAMHRYSIDALVHLGLSMPVDVFQVAQAAAETNTCIEINNKHMSLNAEELRICQKAGASFLVNSDAHRPEAVGRPQAALELAQEAGLEPSRLLNVGENIYIPKKFR